MKTANINIENTNIILTDEQLAAAINQWYLNNKKDKSNIWNRTQTGRAIKNCVFDKGNFKYGYNKNGKNKVIKEEQVRVTEKVTPTLETSPLPSKIEIIPPVKKEKTHTEWMILHINYLTEINNKIKEFKRNHYQSRDGKTWFNNRTHKQTDPPGAPIDNLDEYIKWETEDVF